MIAVHNLPSTPCLLCSISSALLSITGLSGAPCHTKSSGAILSSTIIGDGLGWILTVGFLLGLTGAPTLGLTLGATLAVTPGDGLGLGFRLGLGVGLGLGIGLATLFASRWLAGS